MEKFSRAMFLVVMLCVCSALCKPGTERYKSAGLPIFILCMCYYDFCNKVSANSVVRNECPAVSDDPFCCWGTVLLLMRLAKCALKWFLPLTRIGQWDFNDANNLAWAYRRLLVLVLFMQIITALNIVSGLFFLIWWIMNKTQTFWHANI